MSSSSPSQGTSTKSHWLHHWFARPWLRRTFIGLTGVYLFLVCAAYFLHDTPAVEVSFSVIGPSVSTPGSVIPLRIVGYNHSKKTRIAVKVHSATIESEGKVTKTTTSVDVGNPALVHINYAPRLRGLYRLSLVVSSESGAKRTIDLPLNVVAYVPDAPPPVTAVPPRIRKGASLGIELLSEGRGLARTISNRVWIRVTHPDGQPASKAKVRWTASHSRRGGGKTQTDPNGLASIEIVPTGLSTKLRVQAELDTAKASTRQSFLTEGRACVLRPVTKASPNGSILQVGDKPLKIQVLPSSRHKNIYCDLYHGNSWAQGWQLQPLKDSGARYRTVSLKLPKSGRYRFQCYSHYSRPGDGFESMWVFRAKGPNKALDHLVRYAPVAGKSSRDAVYRRNLRLGKVNRRAAMLATYQTLALDVSAPKILTSTKQTDHAKAQSANRIARVQFFILIGASFGLILLWSLYVASHNAIRNRLRMREAVLELGDLAAPTSPPTMLLRLRTVFQIGFVALVLSLNIVAMLMLFGHM